MAGPFETRETVVVNAIADTVVARTNLVPQTTLTAPASTGDLTIAVDDVTGFEVRGYIHWFDNSGEFMAAIAAIDADAKTITMDYQGYVDHGLSEGLAFDHDSGAVVASNLMLHRPLAIGPMLRSGKTVIAIWPRRKMTREYTVGSTTSPLVVRIQVQRAIEQFDAAPMDPEAYNQIQQDATRDDLQAIENALNNNRHLHTRYNAPGPHAIGLGDGRDNRYIAESLWDVVVENVDIPMAVGAMDVRVIPRKFVREQSA